MSAPSASRIRPVAADSSVCSSGAAATASATAAIRRCVSRLRLPRPCSLGARAVSATPLPREPREAARAAGRLRRPLARAHDATARSRTFTTAPPSRVVLGAHLAAVVVDDALDDRQAEAGAAAPAREERLEQPRQVGGVEARARSPSPSTPRTAPRPSSATRQRHLDAAARGREVDGVLDQVLQHLRHARAVGQHPRRADASRPARSPPTCGARAAAGRDGRLDHVLDARTR